MLNLFDPALSEADVARVLAETPPGPLLPPLGSEPWRRVGSNPLVQRYLEPIRARADAQADAPLPALTDDLYTEYHRLGTRHFDDVWFERRRRVGHAGLALLVEEAADGGVDPERRARREASLVRKLEETLSEDSWAFPAHVNAPSGRDPACIDLFAAETTNLFGEILNLFGALLPVDFQARIRARLRGVFEHYAANLPAIGWSTGTSNWNAVCNQGVLGAALAVERDPAFLARLLVLGRDSLRHFLAGYGPDGGCSEGPGYWNYGFGWFCRLNGQLETRTAGQLSLFAGDPKIRAIAGYGPRVVLRGDNVVNFADCSPRGGVEPEMVAYLGEYFDDPVCRTHARAAYRGMADRGPDLDGQRSDLPRNVRRLLRWPAELPETAGPAEEDSWFPDLAVLVAHGTDGAGRHWDFAAKAGHNGEHHNHNDGGSLLLNVDGQRLLVEIGAPEYTRAFFGPERYENLAARTRGHSLPVVNGQEQAAGPEFAARVRRCEPGADTVAFDVDLTACYPPAAGARRIVRTMRFRKTAGELEVTDEVEFNDDAAGRDLETALIADGTATVEIERGSGGARITAAGNGGVTLRVAAGPGATFAAVEEHAYRTHQKQDATVRRLVLRPVAEVPPGGSMTRVSYVCRLDG